MSRNVSGIWKWPSYNHTSIIDFCFKKWFVNDLFSIFKTKKNISRNSRICDMNFWNKRIFLTKFPWVWTDFQIKNLIKKKRGIILSKLKFYCLVKDGELIGTV